MGLLDGMEEEKVDVNIALVFHGGATLDVLNEAVYNAEFKTEKNPNLELLRDLHHAGVEMYVCGEGGVVVEWMDEYVAHGDGCE